MWAAPGDIDRQHLGDEPLETDLIEGVAARDLVCRRIDVRPDVVQHRVARHRIPVILNLRNRLERRVRETGVDRHPIIVRMGQINNPHPDNDPTKDRRKATLLAVARN